MLDLMPARPRKTAKTPSRPTGTKDVFARLDAGTVDQFDQIVNAMRPVTSRSAVIAMLIQQFVEEKGRGGKE